VWIEAQTFGAVQVQEAARSQLPADLETLAAEIAALGGAADAPALAGRIPESWRVVDGDERVDVSASWLIAALVAAPAKPEAWPATRAALVRRLKGIGDEVASAGDANRARSRAQARAAVETILAGSEFQQSAASRWREQLQERVGQWVEDLLGRFGAGRGGARRTALVFAWAAAIAALIGLGYWLARTIADHPRGAPLSLGSSVAPRPRARDLALRALAAARLGQTREAVRCAYGAALVRLEEQGVWRIDDARTPREYLPMLPTTDSRHPAVLDLTRRFEQIWYGNRAAADDDARRVADHLEALGCLRPGERAI
jgi:Domain of unknown function (DUF4129)